MHHLRNSKYWPFSMYYPTGSCTNTVSRKNTTVKNFVQNHARSQVSIDFSRTISEIQNTGHFQRISPWDVVCARFREKRDGHKLCKVTREVEF
ncbi:hypothetical protein B296_00038525 [Ensete ventricosum]|uniref:Uncharacterized protein n=1 Tax=Ensete ventricosum TaxID=4639 RepID=A0A426Z910_ENSVE|nr:hypothetical protein B296_00038525 [Ensete ventricosum]